MSSTDQPKVFNGEEKTRLTALIKEGITVLQEVEDLNGGLNDAVKALAEELEVKPALIKKAIRIAAKSEWDKTEGDYTQIENILISTGFKS